MRRIDFRVVFETPFTVASAVSDPGKFDSLPVLSSGLPYVPASTIRGRIKDFIRRHCVADAGRWPAYKLCDAQASARDNDPFCDPPRDKALSHLTCPLCRIFGIPGGVVTRGFDFGGAYIPEESRQAYLNLSALSPDILYQRRVRNRIDPALRRAEEDKLFAIGFADMGEYFKGSIHETPVHRRYPDDIQKMDISLLLLGMRLVTELGGGVSRGYGKCRFEIDEPTDWKASIREHINDWKERLSR